MEIGEAERENLKLTNMKGETKMCEGFSEEVKQKINYYVYRLIDPRNGETFMLGRERTTESFNTSRRK